MAGFGVRGQVDSNLSITKSNPIITAKNTNTGNHQNYLQWRTGAERLGYIGIGSTKGKDLILRADQEDLILNSEKGNISIGKFFRSNPPHRVNMYEDHSILYFWWYFEKYG